MTEPLPSLADPPAQEFAVRVIWMVPRRDCGYRLKDKVYKILALSLLEACSIGLDRHKANICTSITAARTP